MQRRKTLTGLLAWSVTGLAVPGMAQTADGKVWRVGVLLPFARPSSDNPNNPFQARLRELGYVEGKNLQIEWRFAGNDLESLPRLAAELVQSRVDVIFATGTPAVKAAQAATRLIPIVLNVGDPVLSGLVASLAQPGGNTTGVASLEFDIIPKRLELLHHIAPAASRVAVLVNPANAANMRTLAYAEPAARSLGKILLTAKARSPDELANAFSAMSQQGAAALLVGEDTLFVFQARQIADLATRHRLPSIAANAGFAVAGGLVSYGPNGADQWRLAATYVDKILKGAKPSDLPVEQPMRFEMVINLKTAKALGLTIPYTIRLQATKMIE